MSFSAAISEVQAQLVAAGLAEYADPRVDDLASVGGGKLDGVYLLRPTTVGEPWIEAWKSPQAWFAKMKLQVAVMLGNDELSDVARMDLFTRNVQEKLLHTSLSDATIFNSQLAQYQRNGKDRRLVWEWSFSMRYVEP